MPKRVIISFCRLNLSLVAKTQALLSEAMIAQGENPEVVHVRCLRCLAQCFTCNSMAYVRVGHRILGAPDSEELRQHIVAAVDELSHEGLKEEPEKCRVSDGTNRFSLPAASMKWKLAGQEPFPEAKCLASGTSGKTHRESR
jgi:uncharacterized protein YuzB (UPF0349 family)